MRAHALALRVSECIVLWLYNSPDTILPEHIIGDVGARIQYAVYAVFCRRARLTLCVKSSFDVVESAELSEMTKTVVYCYNETELLNE